VRHQDAKSGWKSVCLDRVVRQIVTPRETLPIEARKPQGASADFWLVHGCFL